MNLRSFKLNRVFGPSQYVKCGRLFLQKEEGKFVLVCSRPPKTANYEVSRRSRAVDVNEMH